MPDTLAKSQSYDISRYTEANQAPPPSTEVEQYSLPPRNVVQICSLPYLPGIFPSTNNILDFHIGGKVPQFRAPLAAPISSQGSSTTTTSVVSSSSSTTITTNNPPLAQTASVSTPTLSAEQSYTTTITMAKSFYLQSIATAQAARIQLYSTAFAQSADLFRAFTSPPGLGTEQGLIADVYLDTPPAVWELDPAAIGRNGNSPQTSTIYITITNLGAGGTSIMATLTYVPMQS